jgi:hypothetical protein
MKRAGEGAGECQLPNRPIPPRYLQDVILLANLRILPEEITLRNQVPNATPIRWRVSSECLVCPRKPRPFGPNTPSGFRSAIVAAGSSKRAYRPTVYYGRLLHRQIASGTTAGLAGVARHRVVGCGPREFADAPLFSQRDQDRVPSAPRKWREAGRLKSGTRLKK